MTVWGNTDEPSPKVTEAYADMLNEIGLDAEVEVVNGGVYFQTIGNADTAPQTGFANWFQDFPHPLNFYFLVDGDTIQPTNNQNFGNVDDPKINDEIDRLSPRRTPSRRERLVGARPVPGLRAAGPHRPYGTHWRPSCPSGSTPRPRCSTPCTSTTTRAGR